MTTPTQSMVFPLGNWRDPARTAESVRETILVVDDEPRLRESTVLLLTHEGREITQCGTGTEALAMIEQRDVDLILLDLNFGLAFSPLSTAISSRICCACVLNFWFASKRASIIATSFLTSGVNSSGAMAGMMQGTFNRGSFLFLLVFQWLEFTKCIVSQTRNATT